MYLFISHESQKGVLVPDSPPCYSSFMPDSRKSV